MTTACGLSDQVGESSAAQSHVWSRATTACLAFALCASAATVARADEGGVSFWLPGEFGSLATAQQVPGWAIGFTNLFESLSASGNVAAAREITIGKLNPNVNVNLNVNLAAKLEALLIAPSYVFATPVFGGQFSVSMAGGAGYSDANLNGTLTVSSGPFSVMRQGELSDARFGLTDLYPQASLR